jgi:hypothetical protein
MHCPGIQNLSSHADEEIAEDSILLASYTLISVPLKSDYTYNYSAPLLLLVSDEFDQT